MTRALQTRGSATWLVQLDVHAPRRAYHDAGKVQPSSPTEAQPKSPALLCLRQYQAPRSCPGRLRQRRLAAPAPLRLCQQGPAVQAAGPGGSPGAQPAWVVRCGLARLREARAGGRCQCCQATDTMTQRLAGLLKATQATHAAARLEDRRPWTRKFKFNLSSLFLTSSGTLPTFDIEGRTFDIVILRY